MSAYNYAAAFIEFCRQTPVEEISIALAIPLDTLKTKIRNEGWPLLAERLPAPAPLFTPTSTSLDRIEANRAKNLEIADGLRDYLAVTVKKLNEGTLKIQRVSPKGMMFETDPTMKDLRDLAAYAQTVAELGYRALGDAGPVKEAKGEGSGSGPVTITVNLPAQVAQPREERAAIDVDSEVVALPPAPGFIAKGGGAMPNQDNGLLSEVADNQ